MKYHFNKSPKAIALTWCTTTLIGLALSSNLNATALTIDVEGNDSATHSGPITAGTVYKTNAGILALSSTGNAISELDINGGVVAVSAASNLNGASSVVKFNASGTDPVTAAANTAKLHITDDMSTGTFNFATNGTVEVDSAKTATWSAVPTGTGLATKAGSGALKIASNLSSSTSLAGIHVDAGTLYVQSGKAPNAPIQVASGAALQLAGVSGGANSEVQGALTVQTGGTIEVDANKKVGASLTTTASCTFDMTDGYFKNGSNVIAWPPNFSSFLLVWGTDPNYITSDTTDQNITYGGVHLNFGYNGNYGTYVYWKRAEDFTGHPTTTVASDNDAILSGTVLMQSGSSLVLGAGANWARDITVGTPS